MPRDDGRPKVMTECPFCGARQDMDKLHTRFYTCKTTASRDTGDYYRRCGGRRGLTNATEERE